jgi:predicted dienelactone hydrolase
MLARLTVVLTLLSSSVLANGFQFVDIPAASDVPPIEAAIWYPTASSPPETPNTPFGQAVALFAPVSGRDLPLVIISHGDGGWFGGHAQLASAIAQAGMIVVALNHPGNSDGDETAPPSRWITERPRHLSRVADFMSNEWEDAGHIDEDRIGVFGFSAGGHSVLSAAGAATSRARIADHCANVPEEFVCRSGIATDIVEAMGQFPKPVAGIQAVVAVAPGVAFGFDPTQVASLDAAIQIWGGAEDDRVPPETNVVPLGAALTLPSHVRVVAGAGHFAFMPPCNPALEEANAQIWAMACVDPSSFDRAAFHDEFTRTVVEFLRDNLSASAD